MMLLKKIGYRLVQTAFYLAIPFLPYREPKICSSCRELGEAFSLCKTKSVFLVTTKGALKRGMLKTTLEAMEKGKISYVIFTNTKPNPTAENVEEGLALYLENGCDTLLALGGGSVMDCAKAIGARVAYPKKDLRDLAGVMKVLRKTPPLIAIPTTAGSGSETTLAAVITDEKRNHKYAMMSFPLIPQFAVLDPEMTFSLPPHLTAETGMDALTHALEVYIGRATTRKTRRLARSAVKKIFANIKTAYTQGENREARENMLYASYEAGVAFSTSYVGYVHAIAHSLGGKYDIPHGLANAVLLPHVLEGYGKKIYPKLYTLALDSGLCLKSDSIETGAKKFILAIRELNAFLKMPSVLPEIQMEDIPSLALVAEKEANPLYPVPVIMRAAALERFYFAIAPLEK